MAWVDDRLWAHPKYVSVGWRAKAVYVASLCYAGGMQTGGHLNRGQQELVGGNRQTRNELVKAGLWDPNGADDGIQIHDWEEHNEAREQRRAKDRERKRRWRESRR